MKKIFLITSIVAASFSFSPASHAENSLSLRVCEYISVNDNKRLRKVIKQNRLKIRSIYGDIQCNGMNILEFAATSNALDVGEMLIKKLQVAAVSDNLATITKYSAHLTAIAKKRIG